MQPGNKLSTCDSRRGDELAALKAKLAAVERKLRGDGCRGWKDRVEQALAVLVAT